MTVRTDITVDFQVSPRLITVAAPSAEVTIQDLYDTLRTIEADFCNLESDFIISGAGKEELGGGVKVGITIELNDAQLAFESRHDILEAGTVTTADTTGITLIDSTALFQTNNVSRGDFVFNFSDGSTAEVLSVDSEIQITTRGLTGGVDNQFNLADVYSVYDVVQCNVSGGNLVAIDSVGAPLEPIFPTFGTQVVRTSSSSATLQELADIQFSSFNGGVTVDVTTPLTGTAYPFGTPRLPVNNLTDALTILNERGLPNLYISGNITLSSGDFSNITIVGQSILHSTITVDAAATIDNTRFLDCITTGTYSPGEARFEKCFVTNATFPEATFDRCLLSGLLTMTGNSAITFFIDCKDADSLEPILNINNVTTHNVNFKNYVGEITFRNSTSPADIEVDLNTGRVTLESNNTDGTFIVRGIGHILDSSTGSTVDDNNLVSSSGGRSNAVIG